MSVSPEPEPELQLAARTASLTAQASRASRLAPAGGGGAEAASGAASAPTEPEHGALSPMQAEIVRSAGLMIRTLSCGIVGTAFTRLQAYLPCSQEQEVKAALAVAASTPEDKLGQVKSLMEPLMGRVIAALEGDMLETYNGLIDETIRERIPDDSTRCYALLAIKMRERELAMSAVFPAQARKLLNTAHAEAAKLREGAENAEQAKTKVERILAGADHKITALGAAPLAAAKGALNAAADAFKAVEPFYYRTHLCLAPRQAVLMQVEQERAEAEKDVSIGMRIMAEATVKLYDTLSAQQSYNFLKYRQMLEQARVGSNLDQKITAQLERVHKAAMKFEVKR